MSRLRKLRKSKAEAEEYESVLFPREEDNNSDDSSNEEIGNDVNKSTVLPSRILHVYPPLLLFTKIIYMYKRCDRWSKRSMKWSLARRAK